MQRQRSFKRWKIQTQYSSLDAFVNPEQPVVHTVTHRGIDFDLLTHDRGSDTTLVVFHAALTPRALTLPQLQGGKLAEDTGCNLVAVSDPTITDTELDLGWYLGNSKTGKLPPVLAPLIQSALDRLGGSRTIFIGPSGGGYAAILYGQFFPNSIVLAINPRLDLGARPASDWGRYLDQAHDAHTNVKRIRIRREYAVVRLREKYAEMGLPFDLCLYQNSRDRTYVRHQTRPFVAALKNDNRLFLRMDEDGNGHRPIPGGKLREIVSSLSLDIPQSLAIQKAGFSRPS
ncbi:hypothetical protein [Corynebacterium casei]|uniref:hypothetical protein n=1 Tax=Corynebacterium casei TaxID=160386 RepID=UPI003FD59277